MPKLKNQNANFQHTKSKVLNESGLFYEPELGLGGHGHELGHRLGDFWANLGHVGPPNSV